MYEAPQGKGTPRVKDEVYMLTQEIGNSCGSLQLSRFREITWVREGHLYLNKCYIQQLGSISSSKDFN